MSFHLYQTPEDYINPNSITDKVCVLDLDATLLSTADSLDSFKALGIMTNPKLIALRRRSYCIKLTDTDTRGEGSAYSFWGTKRPHIDEFLLFAYSYYKLLIIWSAGKYSYVHSIVKDICKDLRPPILIWTFDDIEYDDDGEVLKPLTKLINSNFKYKHLITKKNTIFIDDNETTFAKNKKNAIHIPPYEPELTIEALSQPDEALLQIKYFLLLPHVLYSDDITKVDMTTIFDHSYQDYQKLANMYDDN